MSMINRFHLAGTAAAAALLLAFPAAAQNNQCAMMCNGTGNACYRTCAGSNDGLSPGGTVAPGSGTGGSGGGYGAIAVSDSDKGALRWGKSYGYDSRARAEAVAVQFCKAGGLPGCKVRVWFTNACAVLVTTGDGDWWAYWRGSLSAARRAALADCQQDAKGGCTVKEAFCSP
ncbi:DUF4189 domain-containing protein [Xanthobacter aminoxidans]|uniref:DUF4189 domain-containing protein n=1 Tax=Xanthobacter aminoxidans TaxID=186280 RepID=UPI002022CC11|nr:DUF4189 domain-containing protein [Xanthobacter aminoxidans]MCL8385794.1 DUF4189 domain-containing protein [Xanthobacter aminoxidans]